MIQEKNIVNILILLAVSDDELHQKEREFIQDFIDEKNFNLDIDQILEEMKNKFRDDHYINASWDHGSRKIAKVIINLQPKLGHEPD